ncbi:N-acetylglucosaminyl transferase component-domain-containing protein [Schizophyllum amplum]|uniref:N-acetylglucosaminyl transferase component-domain-containing protein n=1 Tax=Schizophyllum amplum TaxID=97359 RepID=A0A550CPC7_9AGAR|nr:N-acetylglucosaminyl transferase component-domain-containing protein [Auriculariopsis ampla]
MSEADLVTLDDLLQSFRPNPPQVLGTCSFSTTNSRIPDLSLRPSRPYSIILYRRHKPVTLRYHCLKLTPPGASEQLRQDANSEERTLRDGGIDELVIDKLNRAWALDDAVQRTMTPRRPRGTRQPRVWTAASTVARGLAPYILLTSQMAMWICNAPILLGKASDLSSIAQQVDVRSEQAQFFVREAGTLAGESGASISVLAGQYINFFNIVWLIVNDVTVGIAVGSFLCENHVVLARLLGYMIHELLIARLVWVLKWLDSWPAGLKLNTELSRFYTRSFTDMILVWGGLLHRTTPFLPAIIYATGVAGHVGVSFAVSMASDLLALATAHTYICYVVSNAIYARMLKTAGSLWNLFRGKRFNVLRNRTDSWEYDIDQLLFGTMLFTLLAFLFPTVLAYHAVFAAVRLGIILLHAGLETLLAFINHFPLFALMLRIKDPWRLPGGIYFSTKSGTSQLIVENQPVPLSAIFFQYIRLSKRLTAHYNPARLLRHVLTGQFLDAIPRYSIRYDKMDAARKEARQTGCVAPNGHKDDKVIFKAWLEQPQNRR